MIRSLRSVSVALIATLLAACAGTPTPPPAREGACAATPCPACPACPAPEKPETRPAARPLQLADWRDVAGWADDDHREAWSAFRASCGVLARQETWRASCAAAEALGAMPERGRLRQFFESHFQPWSVTNPDASREGLVTGYYEPLIRGARTRSARYAWAIHGVPRDLLTIELGDVFPELKKLRLRGRVEGNKVVPYWTRGELERMGEQMPAPVLLWADDPIELFFLQVQGSGRVELPDGSRVRIGFADVNGHPYKSIGRWLIDQGELGADQASMQGIQAWARAHPQRLTELLAANPSYVFFRELPNRDGGPLGALGVPLTEGRSIAVDPSVVPLGAPVFLATTWPASERPLQRLVMAQDTGGAIKGAVRADFFWGFGAEAGALAGRMKSRGQMWVLLPRGHQP